MTIYFLPTYQESIKLLKDWEFIEEEPKIWDGRKITNVFFLNKNNKEDDD